MGQMDSNVYYRIFFYLQILFVLGATLLKLKGRYSGLTAHMYIQSKREMVVIMELLSCLMLSMFPEGSSDPN